MGSINSAINCAILVAAIGVVGLEAVAVTLISVYVYTIITNKVVIGFNQRKVAFIITYRTDDVCECIIKRLAVEPLLLMVWVPIHGRRSKSLW